MKNKRFRYAILAVKDKRKRPIKIAKTNNWFQAKNRALEILKNDNCKKVSIERHEQIWTRKK